MEALGHLHEDGEEDHDEHGDAECTLVPNALHVLHVAHHDELLGGRHRKEGLGAVGVLEPTVVGGGDRLGAAQRNLSRVGRVDLVRVGDAVREGRAGGRVRSLPLAPDRVVLSGRAERAEVIVAALAVRRGHVDGNEAHDEAHHALEGLDDPARPETAAHAKLGVEHVREHAAPRASEEIH
eukprot:scaffold186181_cov25-Tisochrysis_lutea.AAC.3